MDTTPSTPSAQDTRMITVVPYFDGFYESFSAERIDEAAGLADYHYECWDEDHPQEDDETREQHTARREAYFDNVRDTTDFKALQNEYAEYYVDAFAKDNGIKLTFEKLDSPKYYNYSTDRIFAYIEREEVARLVKTVDRVKLAALVKEKFTSYSGFSSHYASTLEEWNIDDIENLDHNMIETIIECVTADHVADAGRNCPYVLTLTEDFYR